VRLLALVGWCLIGLAACQNSPHQPETPAPTQPGVPTATLVSQYTATVPTPLRICPETSCAVVNTLAVGQSAPVLERLDSQSKEHYWLRVTYDGQPLYIGPIIIYAQSAYARFEQAYGCPGTDCPVRYQLSRDQSIEMLWLGGEVVKLVEHWTKVGYRGEEVYVGPVFPGNMSPEWERVMAASEQARAQGTIAPLTATPGSSPTPTWTPSPTPG
jgi:hypothetical protein